MRLIEYLDLEALVPLAVAPPATLPLEQRPTMN
jgi:hypothetical protein